MNKLVLIALLGTAAAKKTQAKPVRDEINDLYSRPARCNIDPNSELTDIEQMRLFGQAGSKAFFSGLYQADANVVSDECFGTWMVDTWGDISSFNDKFFEDPFSIPTSQYMTYATNWMSLVVNNADKCQWKMILDDLENWCLDNKEVCLLGKGLETRIYNNAVGIVTSLADIFKMMEEDDTCYNSREQVAEWARLLKNYGQLTAQISGFDSKWDKSVQPKHIKLSTFNDAVDEFFETTKDMTEDMLSDLQFPELNKILSDLGDMFDDIFGKIDSLLDSMFSPIGNWFNSINEELTRPMKPSEVFGGRHSVDTPPVELPCAHCVIPKHEPTPQPEKKHHEEHHAKKPEHHQPPHHRPDDFWGNWDMPAW